MFIMVNFGILFNLYLDFVVFEQAIYYSDYLFTSKSC